MATLSLVTSWTLFGTKLGKVLAPPSVVTQEFACRHDVKPMRHLIALNSLNFSKVTDLYARWEYAAKQTKKVAALHALKIKTHSAGIACEGGTEEVSTRRAFTNISELVDGMRVWHYKRGEGTLIWHFEVGREDKQYPHHKLVTQMKRL